MTIGSSSLPYDRLTANGEILAEDTSKVNLYAKEITINKGDDYAAVTATNGATITIGTANTTSLTTTGEVLSTDGDNGAASSVTLNAGDVTLNYSPNPSADSGSGGDEDHTLYADGRSSLAVNASGTVTIKGPIGAVDSGSSITVDGSTISLTHNIVGEDGVTYNYDLETRGIHVEEELPFESAAIVQRPLQSMWKIAAMIRPLLLVGCLQAGALWKDYFRHGRRRYL